MLTPLLHHSTSPGASCTKQPSAQVGLSGSQRQGMAWPQDARIMRHSQQGVLLPHDILLSCRTGIKHERSHGKSGTLFVQQQGTDT